MERGSQTTIRSAQITCDFPWGLKHAMERRRTTQDVVVPNSKTVLRTREMGQTAYVNAY